MRTIASEWETFDAAVLADAGPTQRREMRRAFYAGIHCYHSLLADMAVRKVSMGEGLEILNRLEKEIEEFFKAIEDGLA